jgi:hypothetical protein
MNGPFYAFIRPPSLRFGSPWEDIFFGPLCIDNHHKTIIGENAAKPAGFQRLLLRYVLLLIVVPNQIQLDVAGWFTVIVYQILIFVITLMCG